MIEPARQIRTRDAIDAEEFAHRWMEGIALSIGAVSKGGQLSHDMHPMAEITNEGYSDNSRIMTLWLNGAIRAQATFVRDSANFTVAVLAEVQLPAPRADRK